MDRIADTDIDFIEECSYVSAFSKQQLYTKSMVGDTQKDEPPVVDPPSTSTPTATPETLDVFHTPEFEESLYPVDQCRLNEASCDVDVEFIDVEAYECTLNKASFDVDTEFIEEDEDASPADGESSGIQVENNNKSLFDILRALADASDDDDDDGGDGGDIDLTKAFINAGMSFPRSRR